MQPLAEAVQSLRTMPLAHALAWSVTINVVQFAGALLIGHLLIALFRRHAIAGRPAPLRVSEVVFATSCVVINSLVMFAGVVLWRAGVIRVGFDLAWWRVLLDVAVFFLVMDLAMYVLHRVAHHRWLFPLVHRTHHAYENPRPLTLFVLNPAETLSFGALWLTVVAVYPATWLGMVLYLSANLAFGMIGHVGVEPMPAWWARAPGVQWISTSTFHAQHHGDKDHNFGFYTVLWDRLFGTLSPRYLRDFEAASAGRHAPRD
jgi:Delta7-sterol 5-desaturase